MSNLTSIKICMGSSCFSRGNQTNAEIIESFLQKKTLAAKITFVGSRCEERCEKGPVIWIGDTCHEQVDQNLLVDLLSDPHLEG